MEMQLIGKLLDNLQVIGNPHTSNRYTKSININLKIDILNQVIGIIIR